MHTKLMNSQNSELSDPQGQILKLSDKIILKRSYKFVAFWNLSINFTIKNKKKLIEKQEIQIFSSNVE